MNKYTNTLIPTLLLIMLLPMNLNAIGPGPGPGGPGPGPGPGPGSPGPIPTPTPAAPPPPPGPIENIIANEVAGKICLTRCSNIAKQCVNSCPELDVSADDPDIEGPKCMIECVTDYVGCYEGC